MKRRCCLIAGAVALVLAGTGCMRVGPDYRRPDLGFSVPGAFQHEKKTPAEAPLDAAQITDRWWEIFGDAQINRLVDRTLSKNPDIQKTAAVLLELQGRLAQARGNRFPALNIGGEASRNQASFSATVPAITPGGQVSFASVDTRVTSNSFALSLPAAFELDLWGRLARADEAARADLLQAEESRNTVVQSVIAEAVSLYLEMESLERRIALNTRRIANLETGLQLVEKRYAAGLTGALEVRQARRSLSQAKSLQPSLHQALGMVQHKLSVLCGTYPKSTAPRRQPADYYRRMAPVPAGLPSDLLLRRPDIRSAEARLVALNARIGEARAARFPSITLTGTFGYASDALDGLLSPGNELWEIAAGVLQPVYDAGRRKAGENIARARYAQGVSDYAKTVLNAFSEVEGALLIRKQQERRRETLLEFLDEAQATQRMAQLRYNSGLVDYLTVLDAILARFQAEEDLILSDLALMQNRVTLHRALGGGWPNTNEDNAISAMRGE